MTRPASFACVLMTAVAAAAAPGQQVVPAASPRDAVARSVPILQDASVRFLKSSGCVSCHHNTLTVITLAMARLQDVRVDEDLAFEQQEMTTKYIERWRAERSDAPEDPATVSNILLALSVDGYPPDESTARMAAVLARQQAQTGAWRAMPAHFDGNSEEIAATATAIRALQVYAPKGGRTSYETAMQRAAAWLEKTQPDRTEGFAYRLLGLHWARAPEEALGAAARALTAAQESDGGWAQTPGAPPDVLATGQALFALAQTESITPDDPVFQRGAAFLMARQLADGSWFVKSRATARLPPVDTGFPHGADQFASITATNWAAMALALGR